MFSQELVVRRIEYEFISVPRKGFCFQPTRPAEAGRAPKLGDWDLISAKDELDVPEEVFPAIVENPVFQPLERFSVGQHSFVVGQPHGPKSHAETELTHP